MKVYTLMCILQTPNYLLLVFVTISIITQANNLRIVSVCYGIKAIPQYLFNTFVGIIIE